MGFDDTLENAGREASGKAKEATGKVTDNERLEAEGRVEQSEAEEVLNQLDNLFGSLEIDGKKVIRDIYRKEQIYSGPYLEDAPDMVLVGNEGFNLKANFKADKLSDKGIFSGKHTQDTAFLIMKGLPDKTIVPATPAISDIKGIIEKSIA